MRPLDDESLRYVREAIRAGGPGSEMVQKAVRAPNQLTLSAGPRGAFHSLMDLATRATTPRGQYTVGQYFPTEKRIQLNPKAAAATGVNLARETVPHEFTHYLRDITGKNTGDFPTEEALVRQATGRPQSEIEQFVSDPRKLAEMRSSLTETLTLADLLGQR